MQQHQQPPSQQQQQPSQHTQTQQYFQPTHQQYQYKIFINQCNGYIGSQLIQTLRNDDIIQINPNIICGTLDNKIKNIGQLAIDNVIQANNRQIYHAILKKSDIIVYNLNKNNARQFQYLIKFIKKTTHTSPQSKPQRIICISSLLTWNGKRGNNNNQYKPTLDNLSNRNSSQQYLMELQNIFLDINNLNIGIQTYIICTGMIYGYGQNQLFSYFKCALQQSQNLYIYGNGNNYIPMIHLQDLCNIVKDICYTGIVGNVKRQRITLPKSRYYFAVDNAKITQKQLITCISKNIGNGNIQILPIQNVLLKQNFDQFTINLAVDDIPTLENWHNIGGFVTNIEKIVSEFNLYRGLKPNKIIVMGPPASGKSKVAQILQKAYGLPVLTVKKVLDQLQAQQNQFATQIKIKLQQIRTIKVQQQRKIFEQAKKKKKGKKDAADQFDPSKIIPRLPDDQLVRVFKRRLEKSDCLNKGYILDGWPKTAKICQALFVNQKNQINQATLPNAAFKILASQQEIKQRVKNLPQNIKQTTHLNQQGTTRRLAAYSKFNQQGTPLVWLTGKVDIKQVPFNYTDPTQFVKFIQRNGPLGFKKKQKPVQKSAEQQPKAQDKKQGEQNQNVDQNQQNQHQAQEQETGEFDLEKLTEHEKQILNQKSRPIRQYLIDNVIPQITEGLLEICKDTPRDPIGFLIKFLQNKQAVNKNKKK